MTVSGIPLHPLVVHAAVVLAPLAAVVALAYAVRPGWRWVLRHVVVGSALAAAASVWLAATTGDALARTEHGNLYLAAHEMWAGRLQAATWVLAAVAVVAWWAVPHGSPMPGHARAERSHAAAPVLVRGSTVLLPLVAVAVLVLVVLTGHAGAEAVWKG